MTKDVDLQRWIAVGGPEQAEARERFWPGWQATRHGDTGAWSDLLEQVALWSRAQGEGGRPAHECLAPWLQLVSDPGDSSERDLQAQLLTAAASAHALGNATRVDRWHRDQAMRRVPVVPVSPGGVAVFLSGQPDGRTLDHALDRLFRRAVATGAAVAVIDLSNVDAVDDALHRTLLGVPGIGLPAALRVVVSGLDPASEAAQSLSLPVVRHLIDALSACVGAVP